MSRETRRADQFHKGDYVYDNGVLHLLNYTQPILPNATDVLWVFANSWTTTHRCDLTFEVPRSDEIAEARRTAERTGRGLVNFPIGSVEQVFGPMYADGCPAIRWVNVDEACPVNEDGFHRCAEPVSHEGPDRCACGAEPPAEDLADAALADASKPKPAPVGWPLGDGHRPTPPPEANYADRYGNGRAEE